MKVNKSGRCHDLEPGRIPWGNFHGNRSCRGSIFRLFPYFVYIAHFTKFTRGNSLFMEKSLFIENQTRKKVYDKKKNKINNNIKKKTKTRPKEERKSNILSRKEKRSFVEATGIGGAPRWRPDFEQRSRRQTKICHA